MRSERAEHHHRSRRLVRQSHFLAKSATLRRRERLGRFDTRAARARARAHGSAPRLITTTWYWPINDTPSITEMMRPSTSLSGARGRKLNWCRRLPRIEQ